MVKGILMGMKTNYFALVALTCLSAIYTSCGEPKTVDLPASVFGHCVYFDSQSDSDQCKELRGDLWNSENAEEECARNEATLNEGSCPFADDDQLGACLLEREEERVVRVIVSGDDASKCNSSETGCQVFGGGEWVPAQNCGADVDLDDVYDNENYAVPAYETCVEPLNGVPGQSAGGQVCTVTLIGACTEEGRDYNDYGSCDDVRTQQPYYGRNPNDTEPAQDPRLNDPEYAAEVEWVKSQINSCACVCCHSGDAPDGPSIWSIDAEDNFANQFTTFGLGFASGDIDSSLLGSYAEGENNGFTRLQSGVPSNDEARMKAFFEGEIAHRGLSADDFADYGRIPPPFDDQDLYVPEMCEKGEGIDENGTLSWSGGRARFVYVLEAGSQNPGAPPSRDLPEGVLWRVDTVPPAIPMKTGEVTFGVVPEGTRQVFPTSSVDELVSGRTYLIYVQTDLMLPSTRCLFVAP